jgi:hypothetical protein
MMTNVPPQEAVDAVEKVELLRAPSGIDELPNDMTLLDLRQLHVRRELS